MATLLNANNDDHNRNLRWRRYAIYPSLWCVYSFPSMQFSQQFIEFALQNFTCRLAKAGWSAQALTQISKSNCSYLFFLWNNIYKDSQSPKFDSNARVGVDDLAERKVGSCLTDRIIRALWKSLKFQRLVIVEWQHFCTETMWQSDQMKSCCSLIDKFSAVMNIFQGI